MKLNVALRIENVGYALFFLGLLLGVATFASWLEFERWTEVCGWGATAASCGVLAGFALIQWGFRAARKARARDYPHWGSS